MEWKTNRVLTRPVVPTQAEIRDHEQADADMFEAELMAELREPEDPGIVEADDRLDLVLLNGDLPLRIEDRSPLPDEDGLTLEGHSSGSRIDPIELLVDNGDDDGFVATPFFRKGRRCDPPMPPYPASVSR